MPMVSRIGVAIVFVGLARLVHGAGMDLSRQHGQCRALLQALATDASGDFEFHIACRARFPTNLCRDALETLGPQPWLPDNIVKTCHGLADLVQARTAMMSQERQLMTNKDLQTTLDLCAKTKANYGVYFPKDKNGHVDLDGVLQVKLAETKKVTEKLNEYWQKHFEGARMHKPEDIWKPQQEWDVEVKRKAALGPAASNIPSMITAAAVGAALTLIAQRAWSSSAKFRHAGMLIATHDDRHMRLGGADSALEMQ